MELAILIMFVCYYSAREYYNDLIVLKRISITLPAKVALLSYLFYNTSVLFPVVILVKMIILYYYNKFADEPNISPAENNFEKVFLYPYIYIKESITFQCLYDLALFSALFSIKM